VHHRVQVLAMSSLRSELVEIITKVDQEYDGRGDSVDFARAVADSVLERLSHSSLLDGVHTPE
jgi:hypothetical protein